MYNFLCFLLLYNSFADFSSLLELEQAVLRQAATYATAKDSLHREETALAMLETGYTKSIQTSHHISLKRAATTNLGDFQPSVEPEQPIQERNEKRTKKLLQEGN